MGEGVGWTGVYQHGKLGLDVFAMGVVCEVKDLVGEWKAVPRALLLKTKVMV